MILVENRGFPLARDELKIWLNEPRQKSGEVSARRCNSRPKASVEFRTVRNQGADTAATRATRRILDVANELLYVRVGKLLSKGGGKFPSNGILGGANGLR